MAIASDFLPRRVPTLSVASGAVESPDSNWYRASKGIADLVLAALLFILSLPLMILTMALVRMTSPGPALYSQTRVGHRGRLFTLYKIRTMVLDGERLTGPVWATPRDPRVTPLGRFLRCTHIDELPQLWNVLRGEMSLVGPRPERPEFVVLLEDAIPGYRDRLLIRPGVTGLAQVQIPPDTGLNSVRRKLAYDLYYMQWYSFWLDLRILLSTMSGVVGIPFAIPRTLLRIPSGSKVEAMYCDLLAESEPFSRPSPPEQTPSPTSPHVTAQLGGTP